MQTDSIARTMDMDGIRKAVDFNGPLAYEIFRTNPLPEVREVCLKSMRLNHGICGWLTTANQEQVKQDITALAEHDDPFWEQLLSLYVWLIKETSCGAQQAVNLILKVCPAHKRNVRSKMLRAILPYREEVNFPLISALLQEDVYDFRAAITTPDRPWYDDKLWYCFTRAIGTLIKYNHITCLPSLVDIHHAICKPNVSLRFMSTNKTTDRYLLVQHRAYVTEALAQMRRLAIQQTRGAAARESATS